MENKTKLTVGVFITLALLIGSGATYFIAQDDDAYFCESRNMVMLCEKLSSGLGTRCYFNETYKVCKEGWKGIEIGQEIKSEDTEGGIKWLCSPKSCVKIK